jgi:non-specific serine/threonine protein kinase
MLAGVSSAGKSSFFDESSDLPGAKVVTGKWLTEMMEKFSAPDFNKKWKLILEKYLLATLRPYQMDGIKWLHQLNEMRMGSILADDMGLGKTIQIIALLLLRKFNNPGHQSLLVVPASLVGNWKSELVKFAPSLKFWIAHPSGDGLADPGDPDPSNDLVITTYGSLIRENWMSHVNWNLLIADEAQAIKNPNAKQTKFLKQIKSEHRIALTGTPVENRLSDLWSLFDFVSPRLLGSFKELDNFVKSQTKNGKSPYESIRKLVRPYILRRLKTQKNIIADLPDKTEIKTYCGLTATQVALYQNSVNSLEREIKTVDGIKRRGIILSYLMRFKQICNHPDQFLKSGDFAAARSGKFLQLKEIAELISEKQEKVIIFTQFKEMTVPLHDYLKSIFLCSGLILHGDTPIKKRQSMVEEFQKPGGPPFFVLSLKAGGTGLTLTQASHVIHFDRWWNPAVENQATDRAYRIGQKKNVLVHKFISQGTLEEKIDLLIDSKKSLSDELLGADGEESTLLTEFSNAELLKIVALDLKSAQSE